MEIKNVGVLGCGTMGAGIAQVASQAGYRVSFVELSKELVQKGYERILSSLSEGVKKGRLTEADKKATLERIRGESDINALNKCDIIIEAVIEEIGEKKRAFAELDKLAPAHTIFASNTSCLSITEMARVTKSPERVVGLHFFNPVPVMKLVEVVRAIQTSEETFRIACDFARSLGKEVVVVKDSPGFIVNFLLIPYLNQAIQAYDDGLATREDIDVAVKLGLGHPMGPLALIDLIGLDVCLSIGEAMFSEWGDKRFAPPPLLRKMVRAGYLGKKAGKGFYDYPK